MTYETETVSKFLSLSQKISELDAAYAEVETKIREKYTADFARLKSELYAYIAKIKPTADTVCSLYKDKVRMSDGKIYFNNSLQVNKVNGLEAHSCAIKLGNDGISFLSAVLHRNNVNENLREFAVRYNTLVYIYANAEFLKNEAIELSLKKYADDRAALVQKRLSLFSNAGELDSFVKEIRNNSARLKARAVMGGKLDIETDFTESISLPIGAEICDDGALGGKRGEEIVLSLAEWELHKEGILHIRAAREYVDGAHLAKFAVNTATRFLFSYPAANKRVLICDSRSSNTVTTFAGILKNVNTELFADGTDGVYVKNTDEEIRDSLISLNRLVNNRIMTLGQSVCEDALEYNAKNQDTPMPIVLAMLIGYPFKYENSGDEIDSLLKNGKKSGVYFLVIEDTHDDEDAKYYRKRVPLIRAFTENSADFRIVEGKGYLYKDFKRYITYSCDESYDQGAVLSALKPSAVSDSGKAVYLDNVVLDRRDNADRRKNFSRTLSVPFGKQGASPVSVELDVDDLSAHLAVIGTTGSGKTAFINSFILAASKLYSPEELELHMIIMVKNDFTVFREEGLPHLKTIVTGNRIFAANDVLDFIDGEMERRSAMIGSYANIYAYNEAADKPLPRCVIIIDEFYQLVQGSDSAIDRIIRIAQTGRAYGISLVVSSIRFPMEVNTIIPLFGNRIEFRSEENAGQLIPQAASRQAELEGAKGLCFFARGSNVRGVRVAYSGEGDALRAHIKDVKSRYPLHKMELQSEIKALPVSCDTDVPFISKNARAAYLDDGVIKARLGRTYLPDNALEYTFDSKNNLLFLFGDYRDTKMAEASLIKDVLELSKDIDEPTVYYVDCNKNSSLKRAKTVIKSLRDTWALSGKLVYSGSDGAEDVFDEIKDIISERENDDECELYPILMVIAKADELFADDDAREELCALISSGKNNNVYFAVQCGEPVSFYGDDKYVTDAILFPDRRADEEACTFTTLCASLERLPAGSTEKGKRLMEKAVVSALDPCLRILCDNNKISLFVPYEYDEEYLKNIV